jgi:hypothetical protein
LAGIHGDWLTACHLIPPQIEHMLRYLLAQAGVITSRLDCDGIEEDYSMGKMLTSIPELKSVLGTDLLFDLRGALVEKPGTNLRNRMAHGLMAYPFFYDDSVIHLWWLLLKLCYMPMLQRLEQERAAAHDKGDFLSRG